MDELRAIQIAEDPTVTTNYNEFLDAFQYLVNTGLAWQLQGDIGATARELLHKGEIESGTYTDLFGDPGGSFNE